MPDPEIRIIPFPGAPLEYDASDSSRTVFSSPQRGFLLGPENFALEPVVQWALAGELPRDRFPIFFYGPIGCGKTHLLRGIYEAWNRNHEIGVSKRRGVLLTAGDFARFYAEASETRTSDDFRRRFRGVAMLLLDDLEQLRGKPAAQEELRYTLDALSRRGGTAVLSSRLSPGDGTVLIDALRARFLGGTTIPILLPGKAVRKRFLAELVAAFRISLPDSALEDAAEQLNVSLPTLHGIVSQLYFETTAEKGAVNIAAWKRFLRKRSEANRPSIAGIVKQTARHFALKPADLRGISRNKTVALARSVAVYLTRQRTGLAYKDIAKYFGNRDPSTIRHLARRIQEELPNDPGLRDHLFRLEGEF